MKKTEKAKAAKPKYGMWSNSAYMIRLAWQIKDKEVIVLSALTACLAVASQLVNLYVTPAILSAVESRVSAGELLTTILAFVGSMMALSAALAYMDANGQYGRLLGREKIMAMLKEKQTTTSYPNLDDETFQKMMSKADSATCNTSSPAESVWITLSDLLKNLLGFAIYGSLLVYVEPLLLAVILATTVLGYFVTRYLSGYGYRHREEEGELAKKCSYLNWNACSGDTAKDIRIFGLRSWVEGLTNDTLRAYTAFQARAEGVYLWAAVVNLVLTFLRNGVAYFYLVSRVLAGEMDTAEFLLYFSAVDGFASWVSGFLETLNTLYRQSIELSNIRECLEYPEPFRFEDGQELPKPQNGEYEIRLENVSFRYPGADSNTLSNINLTLRPGEKLAVVGLNGAGKTTLVKLLCGFLDPTSGRVLLNGQDIRVYNRRQYYELFSAVFQDFILLPGSIAMNVAQCDEGIDSEKVARCIEMAGLTEKAASFSKGCETLLNREVYDDAAMLSGGETQRLMLARALYKDAPVVVLDEPTAALDPIAEADLYQKYGDMTHGKSSVYISHRLASTRFCDRIILIDQGQIREEGTHESLMQAGGKYAELYAVQSKYYQKEGNENEES